MEGQEIKITMDHILKTFETAKDEKRPKDMKWALFMLMLLPCICLGQSNSSLKYELQHEYGVYPDEGASESCCWHDNYSEKIPNVRVFGEPINGTYSYFLNAIKRIVPEYRIVENMSHDFQIKTIKLTDVDYGGIFWDFVELEFLQNKTSSVYMLYSIDFTMSDDDTQAQKVKQQNSFKNLKKRLISKYAQNEYSWTIQKKATLEYIIWLNRYDPFEEKHKENVCIGIYQERSLSKGGEYRQYLTLYYVNSLLHDLHKEYITDDF